MGTKPILAAPALSALATGLTVYEVWPRKRPLPMQWREPEPGERPVAARAASAGARSEAGHE